MESKKHVKSARQMSEKEKSLLSAEVSLYVVGGLFAIGTGVVAHMAQGDLAGYGVAAQLGFMSVMSTSAGILARVIRKNC